MEFVAERFDTVEVNGTFYSLLKASTYRKWDDATTDRFRFSLKGSRFITHSKKLRDVESALANFLASGPLAVAVSHAGEWEMREELTAGFVYLRLHGAPRTYHSGYDAPELCAWAERLRVWREGAEPDDARRITDHRPPPRKGRDAYVYFDNDAEGRAPADARKLKALLESGG